MRKYTQEEKQAVIARYAVTKEPVSIILSESGIPKSTFYGWLEAERDTSVRDTSFFCAANFHRLSRYVSFYNNERPIKMFQYRTPTKREAEYFSKTKPSE